MLRLLLRILPFPFLPSQFIYLCLPLILFDGKESCVRHCVFRPDMILTVDWTLNINYIKYFVRLQVSFRGLECGVASSVKHMTWIFCYYFFFLVEFCETSLNARRLVIWLDFSGMGVGEDVFLFSFSILESIVAASHIRGQIHVEGPERQNKLKRSSRSLFGRCVCDRWTM